MALLYNMYIYWIVYNILILLNVFIIVIKHLNLMLKYKIYFAIHYISTLPQESP